MSCFFRRGISSARHAPLPTGLPQLTGHGCSLSVHYCSSSILKGGLLSRARNSRGWAFREPRAARAAAMAAAWTCGLCEQGCRAEASTCTTCGAVREAVVPSAAVSTGAAAGAAGSPSGSPRSPRRAAAGTAEGGTSAARVPATSVEVEGEGASAAAGGLAGAAAAHVDGDAGSGASWALGSDGDAVAAAEALRQLGLDPGVAAAAPVSAAEAEAVDAAAEALAALSIAPRSHGAAPGTPPANPLPEGFFDVDVDVDVEDAVVAGRGAAGGAEGADDAGADVAADADCFRDDTSEILHAIAEDLVGQQCTDGHFAAAPAVAAAVGVSVRRLRDGPPGTRSAHKGADGVWATALAVARLEKLASGGMPKALRTRCSNAVQDAERWLSHALRSEAAGTAVDTVLAAASASIP